MLIIASISLGTTFNVVQSHEGSALGVFRIELMA